MARNKPLSSQTTKHFVVIRKNKEIPLSALKGFLDAHYKEWALICHKEDIDPVTGEIIPCHYHYVGNYLKTKTPLSTTLNEIVKAFKFDNANGIEIDAYVHLEKALQYLIHKNNPEKTQHKIDEISLGGWTKDELTTYITSDSTGINFDRVLSICTTFKSKIDIIREIGLENYRRYRFVILDIIDALKEEEARKQFVKFGVNKDIDL